MMMIDRDEGTGNKLQVKEWSDSYVLAMTQLLLLVVRKRIPLWQIITNKQQYHGSSRAANNSYMYSMLRS